MKYHKIIQSFTLFKGSCLYVHLVLVNRLRGLSPPRNSVVRSTDRPDMTIAAHRRRKVTKQQQQQHPFYLISLSLFFIHIAKLKFKSEY